LSYALLQRLLEPFPFFHALTLSSRGRKNFF
jgi:hypothetical protein